VHHSRLAILGVMVIVLAVAATTLANTAIAATSSPGIGAGTYIVTFVDEPVASYDGSVPGFAATRPQPGRKIDPNSPAVRAWQQHLTALHDAALAAVGRAVREATSTI
jgi:hypothetical protein